MRLDHSLCATNTMPCLFIHRVFLAGQFEYLMTYLKKLVPDSKQSFLVQFLSHVCQWYSYVYTLTHRFYQLMTASLHCNKTFAYECVVWFVDCENFSRITETGLQWCCCKIYFIGTGRVCACTEYFALLQWSVSLGKSWIIAWFMLKYCIHHMIELHFLAVC